MIKVDNEGDQILIAKVYKAKQEHLLRFWDKLDNEQRRSLLDQLDEVDFQELAQLDRVRNEALAEQDSGLSLEVLRPAEYIAVPSDDESQAQHLEAKNRGLELIATGKVAAFVVAGGQGTRLGWDHPKGTYPVGPVSQNTLFQIFAEQILAWSRRTKNLVPWVIMCSKANRDDTERFFEEHQFFGLERSQVTFIEQRQLPVVDARGKIIAASTHSIATSPDGHGGALTALARSGALKELQDQGVEVLSYFQVDNPLCRVLDPVFLGFHSLQNAEASSKIVVKDDPWEKVGVLGYRGDRLRVIEYSELDDDTRLARDDTGLLKFRAGNIANHVFSLPFLARLTDQNTGLPYHLAHKKVPTIDKDGQPQEPTEPNGYKFERFIFDTLTEARHHCALEVKREEQFEPLKNASGANSPDSVRAAMNQYFAAWFRGAGVDVPGGPDGQPKACEVSPLTALSAEELKDKINDGLEVTRQDGSLFA